MSNKKRLPRNLTEREIEKLLSITPKSLNKKTMLELFANFEGEEAQFIPQDRFVLRKEIVNDYAKENICKEDIHTTIGRYIFNLFLVFSNPVFLKHTGYINETVDNDRISKLSNQISSLIITNEIKTEDFYDYLNRLEWFGFANSAFITPSVNYDLVAPIPKVIKERDKLLKENEEKIDAGDLITSAQIEKTLIEDAKKELKDNSALDLYTSGAKVNFGNQYKNMNIMSGAIKDNNTGNYRIIKKSFIEGLDAEDIAKNGDSLVTGVYSRAVGTQTGGYEGKKMMAAFQTLVLDEKDTDCGSKHYLKIFITKENKDFFTYRYIKKGSSLVLTTPENIDSYIGSYIELRSPMYCSGKKICNKCAGELYYILGMKNIGLTANKVTSIALNSSLKAFHDQSIKVTSFTFSDYID